MNIAELFVNLGIKGSEKTIGALSNTKKGMADLGSTSLEAKAAIVGAVYALERLMSASAQQGTNLSNFNSLTGLSTKGLQQWQYAARQAGVSGEELTGSLKAVQNSMTNMLLGKGAPEGIGMLAKTVGFDEKKARDTFYVMKKLQEFAKVAAPDVGNSVMKSFGLSEGTIAAMRKGVFNDKNFKAAPIYNDGQINQLNKVDVAWKNLGAKIEMAMGKFSSKHGLQLVTDISKITDQVFRMVEAFSTLADKLKLFEQIGKVFDGWNMIFKGVTESVDTISKDKKGALHGFLDQVDNAMTGVEEAAQGALISGAEALNPVSAYRGSDNKQKKEQTININQNLNFQHDGKDHKKNSDSHKKSINDALRQMSSQGQTS